MAHRPERLGSRDLTTGRVEVGEAPVQDATVRVVVDYQTHRAPARADGRLRAEGDLAGAPPVIAGPVHRRHDPVAAVTA